MSIKRRKSLSNVYLEFLGFPTIFLGVIKGVSRGLRFVFSRFIENFEKYIYLKKMLLIELVGFPIILFLIGFLQSWFWVAVVGLVGLSYLQGRKDIVDKQLLNRITTPHYTATILSLTSQITSIVMLVGTFGIGFIMDWNYKIGRYVLAATMLLTLGSVFFVLNINKKSKLH